MIAVASADLSAPAGLRSEWGALWQRDPAATPFQSPGWLLAWWRWFGSGEPVVLTARRAGALVGLLPLYRLRDGGCRKLLPIGVSLSDHIDALTDPTAPDAAGLLLAAAAALPEWDELWFPDLPAAGALARAAVSAGLVGRTMPAEPCPVVLLPQDCNTVPDLLPKKTRRYLARAQARTPAAAIDTVAAAAIEPALDQLFELHAARWRARGEQGLVADARVRGFHRDAARALSAAGMLRLYRLSLGRRVLAVYLGFGAKGTASAYLLGFDPAASEFAPGMQLIAHAIGRAAAEGHAAFDFLRGGEAYKYSFGAADRSKLSLRLLRSSSRCHC